MIANVIGDVTQAVLAEKSRQPAPHHPPATVHVEKTHEAHVNKVDD